MNCTKYKIEENDNFIYNENEDVEKDFRYIKDEIETTRAKLNWKISISGENLLDNEILGLSKKLDVLIVKYLKCKQEK